MTSISTTLYDTSIMKITRLGHAATLIETTKTIVIDPFITDNPAASLTVEKLPKVDYILITHDHFDHFGDALTLAKRDNAPIIGVFELTTKKEVVDAGVKTVGFNIGGSYKDADITFTLTQAIHSAEVGSPSGFVVQSEGKTIYHSGDTTVFEDMKLIPKLHGDIDLALLPIGGFYTMDEKGTAEAVSYLKPKTVVPIHYNTWPPIEADTALFSRLVHGSEVCVLEPGQSCEV